MLDVAMAAESTGGGPFGGAFGALVPLVLMFLVFYFLLIRPQQKKQRDHRTMLANLKTGDRVLTTGGLYGTIENLNEQMIKLRIAENVRVDVARSAISGRVVEKVEDKKK
jgi:preprotein translocase subunit YajC